MSDGFYRAFEDRHRGSRDLIKDRLRVYLPFIEPLKVFYPDALTIDLGCGRGEWLELLQQNGFRSSGVDVDDGMLDACKDLGLSAEHSDAIETLKLLVDESQIVVSGFHIAEHLPFDMLRILVKEALRVLKPGGLLILETPNPENLTVGTSSFYLDPTHLRPIPPPLLAFLPEYYGFKNVKIMRLQESAHLLSEQSITLQDVLGGVSPDFAIIAQKDADEGIMSATRCAFEKEYGISLGMLASRYESRVRQAETKAQQAETKAQQAETKAQQAETKAQQAETKAQQAETETQQAVLLLNAIYASHSWRITAPARWIVATLQHALEHLRTAPSHLKAPIRTFLTHAFLYMQARPLLCRIALAIINKLPAVKHRMRRIVIVSATPLGTPSTSVEFVHLTPCTRRIYSKLKVAIKRNQENH